MLALFIITVQPTASQHRLWFIPTAAIWPSMRSPNLFTGKVKKLLINWVLINPILCIPQYQIQVFPTPRRPQLLNHQNTLCPYNFLSWFLTIPHFNLLYTLSKTQSSTWLILSSVSCSEKHNNLITNASILSFRSLANVEGKTNGKHHCKQCEVSLYI